MILKLLDEINKISNMPEKFLKHRNSIHVLSDMI